MIKEVAMAICDVCGKEERARVAGSQYNENYYAEPKNWTKGATVGTHICPECAKKLGKGMV